MSDFVSNTPLFSTSGGIEHLSKHHTNILSPPLLHLRYVIAGHSHVHCSHQDSTNPEVSDLHLIVLQKDVSPLQISMQDPRLVHVLHSDQDLDEPLDYLIFFECLILLLEFFESLIEITAFAELGDDAEAVVLEEAFVELERMKSRDWAKGE